MAIIRAARDSMDWERFSWIMSRDCRQRDRKNNATGQTRRQHGLRISLARLEHHVSGESGRGFEFDAQRGGQRIAESSSVPYQPEVRGRIVVVVVIPIEPRRVLGL